MKNLFNKLFKKDTTTKTTNNKKAYIEFQWVGTRGRVAEVMHLNTLKHYVENGVIYEDYEIVAYI